MIFDQIVMAIIGGGTIQVDILSNGSRAIQMPFETDNIKEKPSHDSQFSTRTHILSG